MLKKKINQPAKKLGYEGKSPEDIFKILKSKPFLEQWMRVKRLYNLAKLLELGEFKDNRLSGYKFDIFLSFFVQCYHLRDWLVNSNSIKSHVVDKFIRDSYQFGICRNLCLGVKHHTVLKPSRARLADFSSIVGVKIPIVREYDDLSKTEERTVILVDGKNYNALTLATECIDQWNQFLKDNGLL